MTEKEKKVKPTIEVTHGQHGIVATVNGRKIEVDPFHPLYRNFLEAGLRAKLNGSGNADGQMDAFEAGHWNIVRGTAEPKGDLLARALVLAYPEKSLEDAKAYVAGLDKAKQAQLRKHPEIAPHINALTQKDAAAADDLLKGFAG